jgi:hypothetical protein
MISLVSTTHTGLIVETGLAGPEGVAGISLLHGVAVSYDRGIVQIPGKGHALDAIMLPALLHSCPTLREAMHRFAYGLSALTAYASACNRRHPVEQRLARWLLLVHDRVGEPLLSLTHNFIAQMLGVRRSSVTIFAEKLRSAGLIDYTRGNVRIVNRAGLERATCDCYAAIQRAFATAGLPNSLATLTPSAVAMPRPGRSSVSS